MIEVVFNDSTKGAMKIAKTYKKETMTGGAIGSIGECPRKEQLEKWFEGEALGGKSADVIGIASNLDIGIIAEDIAGEERKKLLLEMMKSPFDDPGEAAALEGYWQQSINDLCRLKDSAKSGEPIRIWYSDAPFETCGLYFAASVLQAFDCSPTAIKLPAYVTEKNGNVIQYSSWGEVMPGKFYAFLPLEEEISKLQLKGMAQKWVELQRENAPLRAVVNGKPVSVGEDFYDVFIRRLIPQGEFVMARLIGEVLGRYQFGIGDWWIAQRIGKMIADGELTVIAQNESMYKTVLKKRNSF